MAIKGWQKNSIFFDELPIFINRIIGDSSNNIDPDKTKRADLFLSWLRGIAQNHGSISGLSTDLSTISKLQHRRLKPRQVSALTPPPAMGSRIRSFSFEKKKRISLNWLIPLYIGSPNGASFQPIFQAVITFCSRRAATSIVIFYFLYSMDIKLWIHLYRLNTWIYRDSGIMQVYLTWEFDDITGSYLLYSVIFKPQISLPNSFFSSTSSTLDLNAGCQTWVPP